MTVVDRLVWGLKATLASQIVYNASNVALVLLLTRYLLTPGEFGLLQYSLSILTIVAFLGSLGLPASAARYVTEYLERDESQIQFILRRTAAYIAMLVLPLGILLGISSGQVARQLGQPDLAPLLLVGVGFVPFYAAWSYINKLFQAFNRIGWSGVIRSVGGGVGRLGFAVAFVLLGYGTAGVLLGYVAGFALGVVIGGIALYRIVIRRHDRTAKPEPGLARRILRYSVPLTAAKGANVLDSRVDSVLVGILLNPTAVGFYAVARQVSEVVTVPAASFGFALSPTLGEQKALDEKTRAARIYEQSLGYVLLFYVPAAVGLVLVAAPLVELVFGPGYRAAAPVLQVFSLYVLVHAVNKITSSGLDYLGLARDRAIAMTAMAIGNFVLNLLLIPRFGVSGAAIATVLTYSIYTFVNVYNIHQELSLQFGSIGRQLIAVTAITAVMVVVVSTLQPYITNLPTLFGVVAAGGAVWAVLAVTSGLVDVRRLRRYLLS